eukprot:CAMPEP_0168447740 /NCGR_PEP_ID=MMETSP0228-20121227/46740_1 /TAXON_ID=133427 /ORGANISM="Protoceratium reticulatum, Strain CCCM 535 (=CCMP 1889)" /LENGTH=61 /DNA_ID=CAMNT_0008462263 /DNA_START=106 /DNA_END=288 /DNA_ORIENTATION=+
MREMLLEHLQTKGVVVNDAHEQQAVGEQQATVKQQVANAPSGKNNAAVLMSEGVFIPAGEW